VTRRRCRSLLVLVAALLAFATFSACGGKQPTTLTCTTPTEGHEVLDEQSGLRLCLPPNWRRLRAGDPGWITIYDEAGSQVEQNVRDGSLRIFAVPLEPREADKLLNFSVYVHSMEAGRTLEELGRSYREGVLKTDPTMTDIVSDALSLPVGPAIRVSGTRTRAANREDRFAAYVILHGDEAFYVIYVSSASEADRYDDVFLRSANSIEFLEPRP
jgi:hypothetical protein